MPRNQSLHLPHDTTTSLPQLRRQVSMRLPSPLQTNHHLCPPKTQFQDCRDRLEHSLSMDSPLEEQDVVNYLQLAVLQCPREVSLSSRVDYALVVLFFSSNKTLSVLQLKYVELLMANGSIQHHLQALLGISPKPGQGILEHMRVVLYQKHQFLGRHQDKDDTLMVLLRGKAAVLVPSKDNRTPLNKACLTREEEKALRKQVKAHPGYVVQRVIQPEEVCWEESVVGRRQSHTVAISPQVETLQVDGHHCRPYLMKQHKARRNKIVSFMRSMAMFDCLSFHEVVHLYEHELVATRLTQYDRLFSPEAPMKSVFIVESGQVQSYLHDTICKKDADEMNHRGSILQSQNGAILTQRVKMAVKGESEVVGVRECYLKQDKWGSSAVVVSPTALVLEWPLGSFLRYVNKHKVSMTSLMTPEEYSGHEPGHQLDRLPQSQTQPPPQGTSSRTKLRLNLAKYDIKSYLKEEQDIQEPSELIHIPQRSLCNKVLLQIQSSHYDNYARHYCLNRKILDPHLVFNTFASEDKRKYLEMDAKRHQLSKQRKQRVCEILKQVTQAPRQRVGRGVKIPRVSEEMLWHFKCMSGSTQATSQETSTKRTGLRLPKQCRSLM